MKKIWKYAILLVALSALLCMSAFAADGLEVNNFVTNAVAAVEGEEYFTATYTGQKDAQYLILMLAAETVPESQPAGTAMPDPTDGNILYVNQAQAGEDGVVKFETVYPMALEDSVIWLTGGDAPVALASIDVPEPVGVTVSGTVTSYLNDTDTVTVELWANGATEATYTTSGTGMTYAYSVTGVASGTYTMKVSKTNHVTREYTITVGETAVTQDVKIHPRGDINGDGQVLSGDNTLMMRHIRKTSLLTGYQFQCADINGDGQVVSGDNTLMMRHIRKTSLLW